ncbi:Chromosomal replication initiator, DnaA C-terminal, partial [uncultured Caudovirales phage]
HELVYRRAFLMHELRSTGMTLKEIGQMFKRDHATVLHSLRTHEWMTNTKDKLYLECIAEYRFLLDYVDRESARDLTTDILKCQSYATLKIIKSRIKRGIYAEKVVSI